MKKIFSLLKAVMSQDMNLFVYKSQKGDSEFKKLLMPLLLSFLVMIVMAGMYYPIVIELQKDNSTYIILSIACAFPSILALIEGIYKSQGILFEAKDSELLFSLPISKKTILFIRFFKLYLFQFLYSLLFVIPGIALYVFYEKPDMYFYLITLIMILLFPIIPTVLGCFAGYYIQKFSVNFKSKKIVQTFITMALLIVFLTVYSQVNDLIDTLINNANVVKETISKYYYPIQAYNNLLQKFDLVVLIKLLLLNAIFVAAFVLLASKSFFKVFSKNKEHISSNKKEVVDIATLNFKPKSKIKSLLKKEFVRYFSSPVYMINTLFGLVLLIIATISICINFDSSMTAISSGEISEGYLAILKLLKSKIYLIMVLGMSFMTSITSSSISLEGKTFNISKGLPIKPEKLLMAKVLMSDIVTIPVILICDMIFIFTSNVSLFDTITIIVASFVAPSIAAVFGLIVNLKHPKMDASSDSEVVKQSTSSMVAVFGGIILAGIFGVLTFFFAGLGDVFIACEVLALIVLLIVLCVILKTYGKKKFLEIEV